MYSTRKTTAWLVVPFMIIVSASTVFDSSSNPTQSDPIALHEAEILVCLLPVAHEIRGHGGDIGWARTTSDALNQADYYIFHVVKKECTVWPCTVGHFAVNKHTADVWDDVRRELIRSTELERVQEILRKAHGIDEETVQKYRWRSIDAPETPRK